MSHFICPGSTTKHYIFGKPDGFIRVCHDLGVPVMGQIPIEPDLSTHGDTGTPLVIGVASSASAAGSQSQTAQAFSALAQRVLEAVSVTSSDPRHN